MDPITAAVVAAVAAGASAGLSDTAAQAIKDAYAALKRLIAGRIGPHAVEAIESRPDWVEPHLKLGRLLLSAGRFDELVEWEKRLPDQADSYPALWVLRGRYAADRHEASQAAFCFAKAVELNGCHREAVYGLGQALMSLNRRDDADIYLRRAVDLQDARLRVRGRCPVAILARREY